MEQQLPAGQSERQIAEFIEDNEVLAAQIVGDAAWTASSSFRLELVDEIDDVEEAATGAITDAGPCDRDGEMCLAGSGAADQHDVALMGEEVAAGEIAHQGLVDRRIREGEVVEVLALTPGSL